MECVFSYLRIWYWLNWWLVAGDSDVPVLVPGIIGISTGRTQHNTTSLTGTQTNLSCYCQIFILEYHETHNYRNKLFCLLDNEAFIYLEFQHSQSTDVLIFDL